MARVARFQDPGRHSAGVVNIALTPSCAVGLLPGEAPSPNTLINAPALVGDYEVEIAAPTMLRPASPAADAERAGSAHSRWRSP